MLHVINAAWDIMSNGKERQLEIMLNIINAEWEIMSNGKKH
jgi:curved DNA-binding protein CbpA